MSRVNKMQNDKTAFDCDATKTVLTNKAEEESVLTGRLMELTLYNKKTQLNESNYQFSCFHWTLKIRAYKMESSCFSPLYVTWLVGHFSTVPIIISLGR